MKRAALMLFVVSISACSLLPQSTKDKAISVAKQACTNVSLLERQALRAEINGQLNPAGITWCGVKCPNDPPPAVAGCN